MTAAELRIPYLPERIEGLRELAMNLSWRWHRRAWKLFEEIDPPVWADTRYNPIDLLRRTGPARLAECANHPAFLELYEAALRDARQELATADTWFHNRFQLSDDRPVAYFCAEFGVHHSVPIYSGGLGVLAGDHCKSASDLGVPLIAVGLLYSKGYFDQIITLDGWQKDSDATLNPDITPLERVIGRDGSVPLASVTTSGREVRIAAWKLRVGRVPIYLLDTGLEENDPLDRELTSKLYGEGLELRLKQEWILGVGGVRVLRALGIDPGAWHANEGHATFMLIERLRELHAEGLKLEDAIQQVRARSIFTTHTPVPAGHDNFSLELIEDCTGDYWEGLGVNREAFLRLGFNPDTNHGSFHMTAAAIRLSGRVNAVSKRHGQETRYMWRKLWPGRDPSAVPIGEITNGVHLASWMSHAILDLLEGRLGDDWKLRRDDPTMWDQVLDLDDAALWEVHVQLKRLLIGFIREDARRRWRDQWREAVHLVGAGTLLSPQPLTIGFARRFATYKRADLLFRDEERLRRLLTDVRRPVQVIFAGKAHPSDGPAKEVLQRVYSFTREPRFEGRVAFLEDYDLLVAARLVRGVDLWLNVPRPPLEASGTSGMKAALNAVPQLGTLDGWWAEGFDGENGWALPLSEKGADADAADAEALFDVLEGEIVPLYYDRDMRGIPLGWVRKMKQALRVAGSRFTTWRMVGDYCTEYYAPALEGRLDGDDPPTG